MNSSIGMLDSQGFTFRTMGSIGKRERRVVHHSREGSYNFSTTQARPNRVLSKYPDTRNEYNARRDFDSTHNSRLLIGNNVDSGLGESTPQDFSSCCSSSADSTKHIRVVRIFLCLLFNFDIVSEFLFTRFFQNLKFILVLITLFNN